MSLVPRSGIKGRDTSRVHQVNAMLTATELKEALWVQTTAMQGQACIEEQLCTQMEQLSISLDQHRSSQQELLEA